MGSLGSIGAAIASAATAAAPELAASAATGLATGTAGALGAQAVKKIVGDSLGPDLSPEQRNAFTSRLPSDLGTMSPTQYLLTLSSLLQSQDPDLMASLQAITNQVSDSSRAANPASRQGVTEGGLMLTTGQAPPEIFSPGNRVQAMMGDKAQSLGMMTVANLEPNAAGAQAKLKSNQSLLIPDRTTLLPSTVSSAQLEWERRQMPSSPAKQAVLKSLTGPAAVPLEDKVNNQVMSGAAQGKPVVASDPLTSILQNYSSSAPDSSATLINSENGSALRQAALKGLAGLGAEVTSTAATALKPVAAEIKSKLGEFISDGIQKGGNSMLEVIAGISRKLVGDAPAGLTDGYETHLLTKRGVIPTSNPNVQQLLWAMNGGSMAGQKLTGDAPEASGSVQNDNEKAGAILGLSTSITFMLLSSLAVVEQMMQGIDFHGDIISKNEWYRSVLNSVVPLSGQYLGAIFPYARNFPGVSQTPLQLFGVRRVGWDAAPAIDEFRGGSGVAPKFVTYHMVEHAVPQTLSFQYGEMSSFAESSNLIAQTASAMRSQIPGQDVDILTRLIVMANGMLNSQTGYSSASEMLKLILYLNARNFLMGENDCAYRPPVAQASTLLNVFLCQQQDVSNPTPNHAQRFPWNGTNAGRFGLHRELTYPYIACVSYRQYVQMLLGVEPTGMPGDRIISENFLVGRWDSDVAIVHVSAREAQDTGLVMSRILSKIGYPYDASIGYNQLFYRQDEKWVEINTDSGFDDPDSVRSSLTLASQTRVAGPTSAVIVVVTDVNDGSAARVSLGTPNRVVDLTGSDNPPYSSYDGATQDAMTWGTFVNLMDEFMLDPNFETAMFKELQTVEQVSGSTSDKVTALRVAAECSYAFPQRAYMHYAGPTEAGNTASCWTNADPGVENQAMAPIFRQPIGSDGFIQGTAAAIAMKLSSMTTTGGQPRPYITQKNQITGTGGINNIAIVSAFDTPSISIGRNNHIIDYLKHRNLVSSAEEAAPIAFRNMPQLLNTIVEMTSIMATFVDIVMQRGGGSSFDCFPLPDTGEKVPNADLRSSWWLFKENQLCPMLNGLFEKGVQFPCAKQNWKFVKALQSIDPGHLTDPSPMYGASLGDVPEGESAMYRLWARVPHDTASKWAPPLAMVHRNVIMNMNFTIDRWEGTYLDTCTPNPEDRSQSISIATMNATAMPVLSQNVPQFLMIDRWNNVLAPVDMPLTAPTAANTVSLQLSPFNGGVIRNVRLADMGHAHGALPMSRFIPSGGRPMTYGLPANSRRDAFISALGTSSIPTFMASVTNVNASDLRLFAGIDSPIYTVKSPDDAITLM